jgi:hypothetical protein
MVASVSAFDAVPDSSLSSPGVTVARASLGIAGNKAYAVFGPDLMEGEAEYVIVRRKAGEALHQAQRRAAHQALEKLEERMGCELIYFWTPHPPVERD